MARFSERHAGRPRRVSGIEEATPALRTALWNQVHESLFPESSDLYNRYRSFAKALWDFLELPTDELPVYASDAKRRFKGHWFESEWDEFLDVLEFAVGLLATPGTTAAAPWYQRINSVLEAQGCAYRFIGRELGPLTNPIELAEVEASLESAIPAVAAHIRQAVLFMPPHPNASARNSIKESISAVEAALRIITGDDSGKMSPALAAFEAKHGELHPSLRGGLLKLYGFTSDESGIRHALLEETANVTTDDARFMLVACSNFANYLVALSSH